ncbi:MAG: sugar ABC transporter permease [Acidilobaceae archaeon]
MSRERLLYPLRVAVILIAASIIVYVAFSIFPITYSIYIAFTDANAKNIAPGPRLKELLESRDTIVKTLVDNKDIIISGSAKAYSTVSNIIVDLRDLRSHIVESTPETISVSKITSIKDSIDSKLLEVKSIVLSNETPLHLNPRIRTPLDRAMRVIDYNVWKPIESILLLRLVFTSEDLDMLRREVIPSIDYIIVSLDELQLALKSVGEDYDGFVEKAVSDIDREINELTLHFIGLDNFRKLFSDSRFPYSILKTILFTATSVPLKVIVGVMLAWVFSSEAIYGRRMLRALLLLPWAIPVLLSVTTWRILFTPERGFIPVYIKSYFGIDFNIYGNEWHAFILYNIVEMWLAYPFVMTVTMAAIASVPRELVEASLVDGASFIEVFRRIILPLIMRPVTFAAILTTGASLQVFMVPLLINNGGPAKTISLPGFTPATGYSNEMLILYGYNRAWLEQDYGLSASVFLVVVSILLVYAIAWYYLVYKRGPRYG